MMIMAVCKCNTTNGAAIGKEHKNFLDVWEMDCMRLLNQMQSNIFYSLIYET